MLKGGNQLRSFKPGGGSSSGSSSLREEVIFLEDSHAAAGAEFEVPRTGSHHQFGLRKPRLQHLV